MNFRLYRKNPDAMGLAGVVSMTFVRGKIGSYGAGNLFLFPWLKKGAAQKIVWPSVAPTDATQFIQANPISGKDRGSNIRESPRVPIIATPRAHAAGNRVQG